jgi:putative tryptophan/tyrosine transport system substrate-binding protein
MEACSRDGVDVRRREVIRILGGVAAWPLGARAQQPTSKLYRIGVLETVSATLNAANMDAFRKGLRELGYIEGKNYIVEYRSVDGVAARFPKHVAELVNLQVDVIVTRGTPAAQAAKDATAAIPVVMAAIGEPLGVGVVASLAHPGGNVTGFSAFVTELAGKRVELAKEVFPGSLRVALLNNMSNPVIPPQWEETEKAARLLGIQAIFLDVRTAGDVVRAFEQAVSQRIDVLLIGIDAITQVNREHIAELATKYRLPAIYASREFVDAGGLMTYGVSYPQLYFRAAGLVDKILKGAKPGDIPVQQPTKLELVINLKSAKAIGIELPPMILQRADEIIE